MKDNKGQAKANKPFKTVLPSALSSDSDIPGQKHWTNEVDETEQ